MTTPFFSIILPTYNRRQLISCAIDSVLAQSFSSWELIIIDDGSSDRTTNYLNQKYHSLINKKILLHQFPTNRGVCAARNWGLKKARGKWIAYLDSDDYWQPNYLQVFKQATITHSPTQWFYCALKLQSNNQIQGEKFDLDKLLLANYLTMGTIVHDQKIINQVGVFDESLTQLVDWDFALRLVAHSRPHYLPQPLLNYNDSLKIKRISNHSVARHRLNYQKVIIKYLASLPPAQFYQFYCALYRSHTDPQAEVTRLTAQNQHLINEQATFAKSIWYKIWWHVHHH